MKLAKFCWIRKKNFLEAVNFNSPSQTVIVGNADEIESIKAALIENGAKKIIDLSVSVPSHSSMMNMASTKLKLALDDINFKSQNFSVINNFDAKVKELIYLGDHIRSRVEVCGNDQFIVKIPNSYKEANLKEGATVKLSWKASDSRALDLN